MAAPRSPAAGSCSATTHKTRRVTFQGPENTLTVKVPAEVKMNKLEVGDQVRLTYVEELAISVERTAPAKGAAKKK